MISLRNLSLYAGDTALLQNISLNVSQGETLALIGPSGAGKSSLARLLLRLFEGQSGRPPARCPHARSRVPRDAIRWSGEALIAGTDVLSASRTELRMLRGRQIGLIVQSLTDALNPQLTLRAHINEVLEQHQIDATSPAQICADFNLPACLLDQHPAQFSGGETQRILTALALLPQPKCLILDEPTAALDLDNQMQTLKALDHGRAGRAQILICHDPALAGRLADRIAVLDRGRIIETGPTHTLQRAPQQLLTRALLQSLPPSRPAPPLMPPKALVGPEVLRVQAMSHRYGTRPVLENLTFSLHGGACLAVLGGSGCGKSTLAKLVAGLEPLQSGQITWPSMPAHSQPVSSRIGYVSQFPHRALSGHFTVAQTLAEAQALSSQTLRWFHRPRLRNPAATQAACAALRAVSLPLEPEFLSRRTQDLSGGEAQRLCLARALLTNPDVIIADEPTSALDHRSKAQVVQTLADLKSNTGKAILLVTHDPWVADQLADQQLALPRIAPTRTPTLRQKDRGANVGQPPMSKRSGTRAI